MIVRTRRKKTPTHVSNRIIVGYASLRNANDVRSLLLNVIADSTIEDTLQLVQRRDYKVDIFLIFEELKAVHGCEPPSAARKDLSEFLQERRKAFVKCYHIIAVHPTAQVYLVRDLHNTVHGGILRPAIHLFLNAVTNH